MFDAVAMHESNQLLQLKGLTAQVETMPLLKTDVDLRPSVASL